MWGEEPLSSSAGAVSVGPGSGLLFDRGLGLFRIGSVSSPLSRQEDS